MGWKCDGYENRLPARKGKQAQCNTPSLNLQRITTPLPGGNSDERRGFAYFQSCTVPEVSILFDTKLWNDFVLPMSHAERAVTHSVVALSTLHEDMKARGAPFSREDLTNDSHRFALEQYTRALSCLNIRRHSNDPKLREVLLTCCLLFAFFELLRGQYDGAFDHLKWGITIINQWRTKQRGKQKFLSPPSPHSLTSNSSDDIEASLVEAMSRLHYQSAFFGVDVSLVPAFTDREETNSTDEFESISEARMTLDILFDAACRLVGTFARLPAEEQISDFHRFPFESAQKELRVKFKNYIERLNRSEKRLSHPGSKERSRSIDVMRLYHKTCTLMLDTFVEREGVSYDPYFHEFRDLLTTSERVANSFSEKNGPRPALLLDVGVIPALLYVCMKCPDTSLRRRALKGLESWPHREGPWDSNLLAIMARELIQVETEAEAETQRLPATIAVPSASDVGYITPASRVANPSIEVQRDQNSAVVRYSNKVNGRERKKERWVTID